MATQTTATGGTALVGGADAVLKDLYVGPIVEQLNYKTYMLDQVERDSDHIDHTGRRAVIPVHFASNRGRGSRGDAGTLPTAGVQAWQDAYVNIRYHYYGIEVSDAAIEASASNEGAFISILDGETKGVAKDMRKDINRQVFGIGESGTTTVTNANGPSGLLANVLTVTTVTILTTDSVQYIQVGDIVDVLRRTDGTTTTGGSANQVVARTGGSTKTITLTNTLTGTVPATYGVYISGNRGQEFDGLRHILATTQRNLHSINSTTAGNQFWDPGSTVSASSAVAGESLFEQLADNVGLGGNGEVEVFLTSRGIRRRLADTYQSQKRFNDARAVEVHGGYSAIMVNEIPVVADDDCPRGFAFGINKSSFKWFEQTSPGWLQHGGGGEGGIFHLKDASQSAVGVGSKQAVWQAWFRWYAALGCIAPNRGGSITSCADDNPA